MHRRQAAVHFDEQVNIGPYRLAHRPHGFDRVRFVLAGDMGAPGTRERIKLQGRKTTCHHLLGFVAYASGVLAPPYQPLA